MQELYLLSTGGTMEKIYSEQTGSVANVESKIDRYLRLLRLPDLHVQVTHLMNKDSLEMTDDDRAQILDAVRRKLATPAPIVITHGTDTMVETGLYLQGRLTALTVPVIFTGAMTPLGFEGSDGLQNLTESLFAARILPPGVYLVMHNQLFPIGSVRKDRQRACFVWK
jgi:L-asparaginase